MFDKCAIVNDSKCRGECIVMEYAAGGKLFECICNAGRFSKDE